jgi:hypothetical protein
MIELFRPVFVCVQTLIIFILIYISVVLVGLQVTVQLSDVK